jgi:hypothetical protein
VLIHSHNVLQRVVEDNCIGTKQSSRRVIEPICIGSLRYKASHSSFAGLLYEKYNQKYFLKLIETSKDKIPHPSVEFCQ